MFLYSHWMSLGLATKQDLAKIFGFSKTGSTHVSGDRVIDDGYKIADVENAMSVEAIQAYLGTKEKDYSVLWTEMLAKVNGTSAPAVAEVPPEPTKTTAPVVVETPKKKSTKKK